MLHTVTQLPAVYAHWNWHDSNQCSVLLIADPAPALFVSGFIDANKNKFFKTKLFCLLLTIGTFTKVS
jgi:hypothetical protein